VLVLGALFVWGILWIAAGGTPQSVHRYVTYMNESVSGLNVDSAVKYRGMQVGKVESINIDSSNPERIRLLLQVRDDTPITVDTVATLDYQGLTGLATVNLSGAVSNSARLTRQNGEEYPVIRAQPSLFARLDSTTSDLIGNLILVSENVNALLDKHNRENIAATLDNVAQLSADFAAQSGRMKSIMDNVDASFANLQNASRSFPELVADASLSAQSITRMANRIHDASANLDAAAGQLAIMVKQTGGDIAQFSAAALPEISAMLDELRLTAEQLRAASELLAEDPSVLLYGRQAPEPGPGETRP
ncbi:MAG: MCE family protein, partial [Halioglobus sp.]|nr:MCE family protein [Halioglobus sp.]